MMEGQRAVKLYEIARKLKAVGSLVEGHYVHVSSRLEDQELGCGVGALISDIAGQLQKEAEELERNSENLEKAQSFDPE